MNAPQRVISDMVGEYARLTNAGKVCCDRGEIKRAESCFWQAEQISKMLYRLDITIGRKSDTILTARKGTTKLGHAHLLTFDIRTNEAKFDGPACAEGY